VKRLEAAPPSRFNQHSGKHGTRVEQKCRAGGVRGNATGHG
jgi:hypothetical protein